MARLCRFDTPASLRDLPDGSAFYEDWHNFVSGSIAESTAGGGGVGEFFNAHLVDVTVKGRRDLVWMAFPRDVLMSDRDDRQAAFRIAENRAAQDEYCEWRVTRNAGGKITKVEFVTETPEYWERLWAADRARVVELYRCLVGDPSVAEADLHDGSGKYVRDNKWNGFGTFGGDGPKGIVHLIQSINTLSAALGIVQLVSDSDLLADNFEATSLASTSVDARVALDIDALVRKGLSVTLRDPIGLYIAAWDDTGWIKPNGKPVGDYWRVVRGGPGRVLRLEYEVPAREGFVVGDIRIGGRPIEWGGQVAEHVTVTIGGDAGVRAGAEPVPPRSTNRGRDEASSQGQLGPRPQAASGARWRGRRRAGS
jgi:hypothetical protein